MGRGDDFMNMQSPFRVILNLVLIILAVISVVTTGFVSIRGYRSYKAPEIYTDEQIAEAVKEAYPEFVFSADDIWNIETHLSDDSKSFIADVGIIHTKELCLKQYRVQLTFNLVDGEWHFDDLPNEISFINNEWTFENSVWSVITETGIKYQVSFLPDLEARLHVQKDTIISTEGVSGELAAEAEPVANAVNDNVTKGETYKDDSKADSSNTAKLAVTSEAAAETETSEDSKDDVFTDLLESEDGTYLEGTFEVSDNESFMLIVTEEAVKLTLNDGQGELTLIEE